jgi:lactate permease
MPWESAAASAGYGAVVGLFPMVMGKMIDAQSIVVSAAATNQPGGESQILRYVFWHSVVLASLVGLLTLLQATVLTWMVPGG